MARNIRSGAQLILIAILSLSIMVLFACKKNGGAATDEQEAYLTCKNDGKLQKFNFGVNANDIPATGAVLF